MRTKIQNDELRNEILNNNKMLFKMKNASCEETCMCWGLEVPDAWLDPIDDLCMKLEGYNFHFYERFNVRVQADQVKIKYGELRFYYDVVVDPPFLVRWYENIVRWIFNKIKRLNFKFISVLDRDAYDEVIKEEIPDDKYEEELKYSKNVSNVEVFTNDDGKHIKKTTLHHYTRSHKEPTKFKLLYKAYAKRRWIQYLPRQILKWEPSYKQNCMVKMLDDIAKEEICNCEEECSHHCERCGSYIDDNSRCTTTGWIYHLCKDCADESNSEYEYNGALMQCGKILKTKEELDKERIEIEKKFT